jgi:hypothetical protein
LEDRLAPARLTELGGTKLLITLNNANETLGIVSNGGSYSFNSSNNFVNGGVSNLGDFIAFGTPTLTLNAGGLARYHTIRVEDSAAGTSVGFNDSGTNSYSDAFQVVLDNGSAGATFNGASGFGDSPLDVQTDRFINVFGSVSTNSGGISLQANQQATPTAGNLHGIAVQGTITSSGEGNISLSGRGGNEASNGVRSGVALLDGRVTSTGTGTITVVGAGGAGASTNPGVYLMGTSAHHLGSRSDQRHRQWRLRIGSGDRRPVGFQWHRFPLPVWQLDGKRHLRPLVRDHRRVRGRNRRRRSSSAWDAGLEGGSTIDDRPTWRSERPSGVPCPADRYGR